MATKKDKEKVLTKETDKDFKSKLYENKTNLFQKLDFNPELLNKHFLKSIDNFLQYRYTLNTSISKECFTDYCNEKLHNEVMNNKNNAFELEDVYIKLNNIDLVSQKVLTINFVSDLEMDIEVKLTYKRVNKYIGSIIIVLEEFKQTIHFSHDETGWKINDYGFKNMTNYNESNPIYK